MRGRGSGAGTVQSLPPISDPFFVALERSIRLIRRTSSYLRSDWGKTLHLPPHPIFELWHSNFNFYIHLTFFTSVALVKLWSEWSLIPLFIHSFIQTYMVYYIPLFFGNSSHD